MLCTLYYAIIYLMLIMLYFSQDEWQTKSTKRNKKSGPVLNNTTDFGNDKLDVIDIKDNDQKPNDIKNISRGGGTSGTKGNILSLINSHNTYIFYSFL